MPNKILILHNIRSAQNVGAMFRTAEAIGIDQIILSGYSAQPIDRFGRNQTKVTKAALGSQDMVDWVFVQDIKKTLLELQNKEYTIASVEQDESSIDYKKYSPKEKQVIVMGNEVHGVEADILEISDAILEIPMRGEKESLNVSTACGIILFRLFDK